jgi:hypothetical protein
MQSTFHLVLADAPMNADMGAYLQVFKSHGGKLQLPIGMTAAEPWLLDSVDVFALLNALSAAAAAASGKPPTIELLLFCQKGTR